MEDYILDQLNELETEKQKDTLELQELIRKETELSESIEKDKGLEESDLELFSPRMSFDQDKNKLADLKQQLEDIRFKEVELRNEIEQDEIKIEKFHTLLLDVRKQIKIDSLSRIQNDPNISVKAVERESELENNENTKESINELINESFDDSNITENAYIEKEVSYPNRGNWVNSEATDKVEKIDSVIDGDGSDPITGDNKKLYKEIEIIGDVKYAEEIEKIEKKEKIDNIGNIDRIELKSEKTNCNRVDRIEAAEDSKDVPHTDNTLTNGSPTINKYNKPEVQSLENLETLENVLQRVEKCIKLVYSDKLKCKNELKNLRYYLRAVIARKKEEDT